MQTAIKRQLGDTFTPKKLVIYQIGLALLLVTIGVAHILFSHSFERFSSAESWFEYGPNPTTPIKLEVPIGETIKYTSDITYHRTIDMRWEDTMRCAQPGGLKKYPTQHWPEYGTQRKVAGTITTENNGGVSIPFWDYYIRLPDETASSCYLRSVAIGKTPLGYEKTVSFYTDTVLVNIKQ